MSSKESVLTFLRSVSDISLGYEEIAFIDPENFDEGQIGYRIDPSGNSLISDEGWKEQWFVIACDSLGDPILIDVSYPALPVMSAAHGEGTWEPVIIADTLNNFQTIIRNLSSLAKNRTNPYDIEKSTISKVERKKFIAEIKNQNKHSDIWFWENFLESAE